MRGVLARLRRAAAAALLGLSALAGPSAAQTVDCARAAASVERAVCSYPGLTAMDESLAALYARLQRQGRDPRLQDEQEAWRRERDACLDRACLYEVYERRLQALQEAAVGLQAVEEASSAQPPAEPEAVAAPELEAHAAAPPQPLDPPAGEPAAETTAAEPEPALVAEAPAVGEEKGGLGAAIAVALLMAGICFSALGATRVHDRYGYRTFMNPWNLLYVPIFGLGLAGFSDDLSDAARAVIWLTAAGLLALRVRQNIAATDPRTGIVISLCQGFVAAIVLVLVVMSSGSRRRARR